MNLLQFCDDVYVARHIVGVQVVEKYVTILTTAHTPGETDTDYAFDSEAQAQAAAKEIITKLAALPEP